MKSLLKITLLAMTVQLGAAMAQTTVAPSVPQYGEPISSANAKRVAAAALAEAQKNGWRVVVSVVDSSGSLLYLERMEGVQTASVDIAVSKAKASVSYRRPSKALADAYTSTAGRIALLPNYFPFEGGVPLIADGRLIGAVGVSGVTEAQDGQIANAGAAAAQR
jgi:glc operon protein GlcG